MSIQMDEATFLAMVDEILEVDSGSTSMDANLDDIDWDSLANIGFIAEVDSKYGLVLDAEKLASSETVADLYALYEDASDDK